MWSPNRWSRGHVQVTSAETTATAKRLKIPPSIWDATSSLHDSYTVYSGSTFRSDGVVPVCPTHEWQGGTWPACGVLENDQATFVRGVSAQGTTFETTHGSVTLASDGSFRYTPDDGYTGPDAFNYVTGNPGTGIRGATRCLPDDLPTADVGDEFYCAFASLGMSKLGLTDVTGHNVHQEATVTLNVVPRPPGVLQSAAALRRRPEQRAADAVHAASDSPTTGAPKLRDRVDQGHRQTHRTEHGTLRSVNKAARERRLTHCTRSLLQPSAYGRRRRASSNP